MRFAGDSLYVITLNIDNKPVSCRFDLGGGIKSNLAEVMFEKRKIELHDGIMNDEYGPYMRHAYRIKMNETQ